MARKSSKKTSDQPTITLPPLSPDDYLRGFAYLAALRDSLVWLRDLIKKSIKQPPSLRKRAYVTASKIRQAIQEARSIRMDVHAPTALDVDHAESAMLAYQLLGELPTDEDMVGVSLDFLDRVVTPDVLSALEYFIDTLSANPPAPPPVNIRDAATEARDKYIYDEWQKGTTEPKIRGKVNSTQGWAKLGTKEGVKRAAQRYAKRHNLTAPTPRNPGRKKSTEGR
jgi:hypothetical protein